MPLFQRNLPKSYAEQPDDAVLKAKFGDSAPARRAQLRNEILVRSDEILAELGKGWSLRAIWTALYESNEIRCGYKTFIGHVRRLQRQAAETKPITPEKRKAFTWDSTPKPRRIDWLI